MSLGEAQGLARERMARYCENHCGKLQITHAQKLKDRWLIDFDTPARKFTVAIDQGGIATVSVWDK